MDTFDDLLASSLEENPFADPFAKRSNSPDPWASPFAASQGNKEAFESTTTAEPSYATYAETSYTPHATSASESATEVIHDPLDSESLAHSDDTSGPDAGTIRSPGFKESVEIDTSFSETATIRAPHSDVVDSLPVHDSANLSTPHAADDLLRESRCTPTSSDDRFLSGIPDAISPSPSASDSHFTLPPQPPSLLAIERSITNLTLGGESHGGWTTDQPTWDSERSLSVAPQPPVDDDSDDDKPIRQSIKSYDYQDGDGSDEAKSKIQPLFVITVDDPQKVGDPIRSYMMYTVHTRTTSPLFPRSSFSVLRRYSDFLWLYETLAANNPGVVVPPVPEKSALNRFDEHFVRQRRLALENCVQKTANHPVLCKDSDLKMFLESDTFALDIKHRKAELAHERGGGLFGSFGQSITGSRFHETDEWFDKQRSYLDGLESQLRGLVKAVEIVAKQRQEVALAAGEFAQSIADIAEADISQHLSASLAGLADIERKYQELQNAQAEQDMVTFMSTADEYTRLIGSVRSAFNSRIRVYHSWKTSESDLLRIKQSHEKDRAQGRLPSERLAYSLSRIAEAERRAMEAKQEYEHVSKLVKTEMARFERERVEDFKDALKTFLEGMITRQKELIAAWESYQQGLLRRVGDGNTSLHSTASVAS
ncbi:Vps5 C terminal like domain containing protein [Amanita muscaria]